MQRFSSTSALGVSLLCLAALSAPIVGCGADEDDAPADAGRDSGSGAVDAGFDAAIPLDAPLAVDGSPDAPATDAPDAQLATFCVVGSREVPIGTRTPAGDGCNWCDCQTDGTLACTTRTCRDTGMGCEYDGRAREYGERFTSMDGCNECVCAASGLACTRRICGDGGVPDEGAILLSNLNEPCGPVPTFTGEALLAYLRDEPYRAPLAYNRGGTLYPETRADTMVTVRVSYTDGFIVCRIPSPGQEAIDMEVDIEWRTDDGAFDEGFHAYLRRTTSVFVDQVDYAMSVDSYLDLHGSFDPSCIDPRYIGFSGAFLADHSATGAVGKTCETDIFLDVGSWSVPPE